MSTQVFPSLAGLGWDVNRSEKWSSIVNTSVSGNENRIALWTYPRHQWDLTYDFLRQGTINGSNYTEYSQLAGFFNARQGQFDSFLYTDVDDNSVTGQTIGVGDGTTTKFQLVRPWGGYVEPILAPNVVTHVYNNGTDSGGWTVSNWGTSTPGIITYSVAPAAGHTITADFSYYFPVRFTTDDMTFNNFVKTLYALKKISLISLKN